MTVEQIVNLIRFIAKVHRELADANPDDDEDALLATHYEMLLSEIEDYLQ